MYLVFSTIIKKKWLKRLIFQYTRGAIRRRIECDDMNAILYELKNYKI